MQLQKRFMDLTPWRFTQALPLGKDIADIEDIYLILKERPEDHINSALIYKKRSEGDITYLDGEVIVQLEATDFNGTKIGYNYFGGIVYKIVGEPGFNEDNGNFDVQFDYPVYFTGTEPGDQVANEDALLDIYLQMIKVQTFTAGAGGQTVFSVGEAIKDNVVLRVEVEGQIVYPTNGVMGFAGGLYAVDFNLGTITFADPIDEGSRVIITFS